MSNQLGVLLVHGMGNQPRDFARKLIRELERRLRAEGAPGRSVVFQAAHWGSVLESRENDLYDRLDRGGRLNWERLRRDIVTSGFGDALAYQGPPHAPSWVYGEIHAEIAHALAKLSNRLDQPSKTPLVVFAHSLGCAIMSNYIWDAQHGRYARGARSGFARAETLSAMITFGCNLPLFTLAMRPSEIEPILVPAPGAGALFPGTTVAERKAALRWLNFYGPNDILGMPLRPINRGYRRAVSADVVIDAGSIFSAHTKYWRDNDFTKPAAKAIQALLDLHR
jgi:hypothetical protein